MRVLHVIPSLSAKDGGPSFALPLMARGLAQAGVEVDVLTTDGNGPPDNSNAPVDHPDASRITNHGSRITDHASRINYIHLKRQFQFYKVSFSMTRWLSRNIEHYDLVHIHALFSYASTTAAWVAARHNVPYVVRPLGVLNRWGMENRRRWLKRLSFNLIEGRILRNATAIHYTSRQEQLEAEVAGVKTPPYVIPLGIDVSEFECLPHPDLFFAQFPQAAGRKIILFLSRIDAKKGLDLLLPAFAAVHREDPAALLVIAGTGDEPYVAELRALAERLKISEQVIWAGFLSGQEKLAALAAASVFALPSYSENFGIAVVEALASGLPCVISDQVGIAPDVAVFEAGLIVACRVDALAAALKSLTGDSLLRKNLGENARRLANRCFSTEAMTGSLISLYQGIAKGNCELRKGIANCELRIANFEDCEMDGELRIGKGNCDLRIRKSPNSP